MMATPVARVVLLSCGSFNPITNMHLRMFELARDFLNTSGEYSVIGGIISPVSDAYVPRASKELVSSKHRCAMIRLALKSTSWIHVDTWESEQSRWLESAPMLRHFGDVLATAMTGSHNNASSGSTNLSSSPTTIDTNLNSAIYDDTTVGWLNKMMADGDGPVQLKMLCGADILESFLKPKLYKNEDIHEIVSEYGLVVITRADSRPLDIIYESDILTKYRNNIIIVNEWIPNNVSSTRVRTALRRGQSVKYLVQDSVIDYIYRHRLYGTSSSSSSVGTSVASTDSSCLSSGAINENKYETQPASWFSLLQHVLTSPVVDDTQDQCLPATSFIQRHPHHLTGSTSCDQQQQLRQASITNNNVVYQQQQPVHRGQSLDAAAASRSQSQPAARGGCGHVASSSSQNEAMGRDTERTGSSEGRSFSRSQGGYRRHGAVNYDRERQMKRDESSESIHAAAERRDIYKRQRSQETIQSDKHRERGRGRDERVHGGAEGEGRVVGYRKNIESNTDSRRCEYRREESADSVLSVSNKPVVSRRENSVDSILSSDRRRREYGRDGSADSVEHEHLDDGRSNAEERECHRSGKEFLVRGVWMSDAADANRISGRHTMLRGSANPSAAGVVRDQQFDSVDSELYGANRLSQYRAGYAFGSERLMAMTRQMRDVRATPETCV